MRKTSIFIVLIVALALVLAACGQLTPPEAATQAPQPSATVEQAAATQPASGEATSAPSTTAVATAEPACRVDTNTQTDPTLADRFPKIGNTEWAQGKDTAYVNITEYSDFQ